MQRTLLRSKIHRVRVTGSALNYIGSIGIDEDLVDAARLAHYEKVLVVNVDNGERFETYVVPEERGSGKIVVMGAAARLVHAGDILIIMAFGLLGPEEIAGHTPTVVFVDERNRIRADQGDTGTRPL